MAIAAQLRKLFTSKKAGCISQAFSQHESASSIMPVLDPVNQEKACDLVKKLQTRSDMTSKEKADTFVLQMLDWAQTLKRDLADSAINCLREMALAATRAEELAKNPKEKQ